MRESMPKSVTGCNLEIETFLKERGIPLSSMGLADYAVSFQDAEQLVELAKKNRVIILGGDVYEKVGHKISIAYMNWFIDQSKMSTDDVVNYSCDKAIEHIRNAYALCGEQTLISIVFG